MTWAAEVQVNRTQLARATGAKPAPRSLLPAAHPAPANCGLGPIAVVVALLGSAVYCSKQSHKLQGRRLPPLLERIRRALQGGGGRRIGSSDNRDRQANVPRPAAAAAAAAELRSRQQQQQAMVRCTHPRWLLVAKAVPRACLLQSCACSRLQFLCLT
jgi:hypothetical protein